jgi:hypothetical protein
MKMRFEMRINCASLTLAAGLAAAIFCPGAAATQAAGAGVETFSVLRAESKPVAVPVADRNMTFATGHRLPLLQKNAKWFIGLVTHPNGALEICAIPRFNSRGEPTAWVTRELEMVMAQPVRTGRGVFEISPYDTLPVRADTSDTYAVALKHGEREVLLMVSKALRGITRAEQIRPAPADDLAPPAPPTEAAPAAPPAENTGSLLAMPPASSYLLPNVEARSIRITRRPEREPDAAPLAPPLPPEPEIKISFTSPEELASPPDASPETPTAPAESPVAALESGPDPSPQTEVAAQDLQEVYVMVMSTESPPAAPGPAEPDPPAAATDPPIQTASAMSPWVIPAASVAGLLLLAGAWRVHRRRTRPAASASEDSAVSPLEPVTPVPTNVRWADQIEHDALRGEVDSISLMDLVQFLNATHESGCLSVTPPGECLSYEAYFRNGEIIDASAGDKQVNEAVHRILATHRGAFAFTRRDMGSVPQHILRGTTSLLLDHLTRCDEPEIPPPPPPAAAASAPHTKPRGLRLKAPVARVT